MTTVVVYPLLTVALYYLGAWAKITWWLRSWFPDALDELMKCSACSGFWYGVGCALVGGLTLDLPFLGLPGDAWYTPLAVGLCSMAWTPPLAWLHLAALDGIHEVTTRMLDKAPPEDGDDAA